MCCFFAALVFFGPRLAVIVWWLFRPLFFSATFSTIIWPLLGLIFAPWTLLMYLIVAPGGIFGLQWLVVGLGVLLDIMSYGGGGYSNRERFGY